MAKKTPYWHPRLGTPDGRHYCAADRGDIARLLNDARKERRVYRTLDTHGARWYVLRTSGDSPYESGRVFMPMNHPA